MNDRELLELAAKVPGVQELIDDLWEARRAMWNPLTDDADALRLAIKLNITIQFPWDHKCKLMQETRCWNDSDDPAIEEHKDDPYAATRRAIVRAAAEIGRQMQEGGAA